jgi:hypothetical protein
MNKSSEHDRDRVEIKVRSLGPELGRHQLVRDDLARAGSGGRGLQRPNIVIAHLHL